MQCKAVSLRRSAVSSVVFLFLRVKKEVDDVIGMKQEISYDDLGQLVYLSQVHIGKFGACEPIARLTHIHSFIHWISS